MKDRDVGIWASSPEDGTKTIEAPDESKIFLNRKPIYLRIKHHFREPRSKMMTNSNYL